MRIDGVFGFGFGFVDDKDSCDNDNGGWTFNKLSYRRPGLRVGHLAATT